MELGVGSAPRAVPPLAVLATIVNKATKSPNRDSRLMSPTPNTAARDGGPMPLLEDDGADSMPSAPSHPATRGPHLTRRTVDAATDHGQWVESTTDGHIAARTGGTRRLGPRLRALADAVPESSGRSVPDHRACARVASASRPDRRRRSSRPVWSTNCGPQDHWCWLGDSLVSRRRSHLRRCDNRDRVRPRGTSGSGIRRSDATSQPHPQDGAPRISDPPRGAWVARRPLARSGHALLCRSVADIGVVQPPRLLGARRPQASEPLAVSRPSIATMQPSCLAMGIPSRAQLP